MKKLIFIIIIPLFTSFGSKSKEYSKYTLVEFNTEWNQHNNIKKDYLAGIKIERALVERQPKHWRDDVKSVPLLYLYKGREVVKVWVADISLKLNISESDIYNAISEND